MKASVIKIMTKLYSSIKTIQKITPVKPPNLVHRLFLVEECHSHKLKAIFFVSDVYRRNQQKWAKFTDEESKK